MKVFLCLLFWNSYFFKTFSNILNVLDFLDLFWIYYTRFYISMIILRLSIKFLFSLFSECLIHFSLNIVLLYSQTLFFIIARSSNGLKKEKKILYLCNFFFFWNIWRVSVNFYLEYHSCFLKQWIFGGKEVSKFYLFPVPVFTENWICKLITGVPPHYPFTWRFPYCHK